ncbi:MAG: hypothetical protein ACPHK8_04665 [Thermoplasmatota archaeon]
MEAKEAASVLLQMEHHEESLTARASGLTSMVWGLAVAAIFLGYQTLSGWAETNGAEWLDGFLWAPWVLMAVVLTRLIWNTLRVHVDPELAREGSRRAAIACGGVGLAAAALTILFTLVLQLDWNTHVVMLMVTAFMAAASAALQWKFLPQPAFFAAAAAGVGVALWMGVQEWAWEPAGFTAALTAGLMWFVPGYITYRRG